MASSASTTKMARTGMNRRGGGLPARAGIGLKPDHAGQILTERPDLGFVEVHAENYMGAGGPGHWLLTRIRALYPLSLHGVGLSIGAPGPLDSDHLERLRVLCERYEPASFSEHLAWSTHDGLYLNDLLPVAYDLPTLRLVVEHVDQVQSCLRRPMLLENPSTYVSLAASTMGEIEFLTEIVRRSGCGLLLDINNVHVSATNHGYDPSAFLSAFPIESVGELHLAGAAADTDSLGAPLLIDSHDRPVARQVWELFAKTIARSGPLPTLIEWDTDIPELPVLLAEAIKAETLLAPAAAPGMAIP